MTELQHWMVHDLSLAAINQLGFRWRSRFLAQLNELGVRPRLRGTHRNFRFVAIGYKGEKPGA